MKKDKSVKKNYEFKRILKRGNSTSNQYVRIACQKNKDGKTRLGIAIRKEVKSSILRNRLKRVIREIYRLNENKIKKGFDVIILINKPDDNYNNIKFSIENGFRKLNMYEEIYN